jgi:GTP-binding protein HflX
MEAVDGIIREIGAEGKQTLLIFNKIDRVADPEIVASTLQRYPGSVGISAKTGAGMASLIDELEIRLAAWRLRVEFRIPAGDSSALAELHRVGHVLSCEYDGDVAVISAHVPPESKGRFAAYEIEGVLASAADAV